MKTYEITAQVEGSSLETFFGTMQGFRTVPPFCVEAENEGEAEQLAREIVDPLDLTVTHIISIKEVT